MGRGDKKGRRNDERKEGRKGSEKKGQGEKDGWEVKKGRKQRGEKRRTRPYLLLLTFDPCRQTRSLEE